MRRIQPTDTLGLSLEKIGMAKVTLVFAVLLAVLGVGFYLGTGSKAPTALIPTWFGLALGVFGILAISPDESRRKLFMHINVTIGLLGFLGAAGRRCFMPSLPAIQPRPHRDHLAQAHDGRPAAHLCHSLCALFYCGAPRETGLTDGDDARRNGHGRCAPSAHPRDAVASAGKRSCPSASRT